MSLRLRLWVSVSLISVYPSFDSLDTEELEVGSLSELLNKFNDVSDWSIG